MKISLRNGTGFFCIKFQKDNVIRHTKYIRIPPVPLRDFKTTHFRLSPFITVHCLATSPIAYHSIAEIRSSSRFTKCARASLSLVVIRERTCILC